MISSGELTAVKLNSYTLNLRKSKLNVFISNEQVKLLFYLNLYLNSPLSLSSSANLEFNNVSSVEKPANSSNGKISIHFRQSILEIFL